MSIKPTVEEKIEYYHQAAVGMFLSHSMLLDQNPLEVFSEIIDEVIPAQIADAENNTDTSITHTSSPGSKSLALLSIIAQMLAAEIDVSPNQIIVDMLNKVADTLEKMNHKLSEETKERASSYSTLGHTIH